MLDAPVGTGRFLQDYVRLGAATVCGVDVSEEMLGQARRKTRKARLQVGDVRSMADHDDQSYDVVVCVRFLDLIDQDAMRVSIRELLRVARRSIILTIRLGDRYVLKSNTATHDERAFRRLVRQSGWEVAEEKKVFDAGWHVMRLARSTGRAR